MDQGNFFQDLPDASAAEVIQELTAFAGTRVRVERIVSDGQATPDGFWYDQAWSEWVIILRGGADLALETPDETVRLGPGDWYHIPPHRRHRVSRTEPGTLWLAVHGGGDDGTA
ncbi:MAG: cupin domain-containing protein [Planctomycetes bacterium]|nr:cupin domain-containing protein [Planctomycetota bacterium]